ncbi:hypothetical protein [Paenibacillus taihuensis]|uniref:hypothetical protein n=1 Tax=Paenibacillus taihuensis TaxID=1156355 RepID=UPI0015F29A58|nr:hypothetical protein [Paenibacillus taihuensis]
MFDRPVNLRHLSKFCISDSSSAQFLQSAILFGEAIGLPAGKELLHRYGHV